MIVTIHKWSVGALEYVEPSSMIATTIITTLKQDNCGSFRNLAKTTQLRIPSGGLCSWSFYAYAAMDIESSSVLSKEKVCHLNG